MMLLGGIYMLNDYEIQKIKIDKYSKVISILKLIAASLTIVCSIILLPQWIEQLDQLRTNEEDTLKFRVIANSNSTKDQLLKNEIAEELSPILEMKSSELEFMNEDEVVQIVTTYLSQQYENVNLDVKIENHLTPPKILNGLFYPQGFYHTFVVTIGEGRGNNFWCSIFPDVCEGPNKKDKEDEEEEVKFILWEWIKQLFS